MKMKGFPFGVTDWETLQKTEHKGDSGVKLTGELNTSDRFACGASSILAGYVADHWCVKGHILFCIEGELRTELQDGRQFTLLPGMSYQVADDAEAHRSSTTTGAKLFIVD